MEQAANDLTAVLGERKACKQLGLARATHQRHQMLRSVDREIASLKLAANDSTIDRPDTLASTSTPSRSTAAKTIRVCPRALTPLQRQAILDAVHQTRFMDRSVPYIYATLLDENLYYGSISTMYRVLRGVGEVGERRDLATRPAHVKPELLRDCSGPSLRVGYYQITRAAKMDILLPLHLYAVIDIYSRYVVGWMVADRESSTLAKLLLETTIREQGADPTKLTVHADRGSSMKSKPVAFMLADLGVTKSHSRPHVSNDNPHIESLFKTTKYQPTFPSTFANIVEARVFCRAFYGWYNTEHRHSGIALLTPADVHYGNVVQKTALRQTVLDAAYADHPERFVRGRATPLKIAPATYINRPSENATDQPQAA